MRWPLLFGYVALLDAALVAIALRRSGRVGLLLAASAATALMLPMWAGSGLGRSALWGPSLAAIGLAVLLNLPSRLARRLRSSDDDGLGPALESVGLVASAGLLLFAFVLVVRGFGEPPWTFLVVLLALLALLLERTGERRLPQVLVAGALALSVLVQLWFFRARRECHRAGARPEPAAAAGRGAVARRRPPRPGSGRRGRRRSRGRGGGARRDRRPVRVPRQRRARGRRLAAVRRAGAWPISCWWSRRCAAGPVSCPWPSRPRRSSPRAGTRRTSSSTTCPWPSTAYAGFTLGLPRPALRGVPGGSLDLGRALGAVAGLGVRRSGLLSGDAQRLRRRLGQGLDRRAARWASRCCRSPRSPLPSGTSGPEALACGFGTWRRSGRWRSASSPWRSRCSSTGSGSPWAGPSRRSPCGGCSAACLTPASSTWVSCSSPPWACGSSSTPRCCATRSGALPVFNWLLYTYGVPALCCFFGGALIRRAEGARPERARITTPCRATARGSAPRPRSLGILLTFWLINLEVADFFSPGRYIELSLERHFARNLTLSAAWGLYAMVLLVLGLLALDAGAARGRTRLPGADRGQGVPLRPLEPHAASTACSRSSGSACR